MTSWNKVLSYQNAVATVITNEVQPALSKTDQNGCAFTFYSGTRTIAATIPAELTFIQSAPKVVIASDYSQATVTIKTNLPTQITDNGQLKQIMQLSCTISVTSEVSDAKRIDGNTVQVVLPPTHSSDSTRHCKFTYSGSGDKIYSQETSFSL
jgi:hypothetical protein